MLLQALSSQGTPQTPESCVSGPNPQAELTDKPISLVSVTAPSLHAGSIGMWTGVSLNNKQTLVSGKVTWVVLLSLVAFPAEASLGFGLFSPYLNPQV